MQNKANFPKSQMSVIKALTRDYEKKTLGERGKNKANSKPNKANLLNAQMNVTVFYTKDYENMSNWAICENKANSKPKQTQSKPISPPHAAKQTQYKPNQTQPVVSLSNLSQRQNMEKSSSNDNSSRQGRRRRVNQLEIGGGFGSLITLEVLTRPFNLLYAKLPII
jgi:hypothetical protein